MSWNSAYSSSFRLSYRLHDKRKRVNYTQINLSPFWLQSWENSLSVFISAMLLTHCCPMVLRSKFSICATKNMIWFLKVMLKLTLIHSRMEIPNTNYVLQCNMVPNSCKHVHAYQDNLPKMKLPKFGGRGAAPPPDRPIRLWGHINFALK